MIKCLYNMITSYYDDLTILGAGTSLRARRPIRLLGRKYWCLQYNHAGAIEVTIDSQSPRAIQGPSLLLTAPGHDYVFGSGNGWHHNYVAFAGGRVQRYIRTGFLPVSQPLLPIHDSHAFLAQLADCVGAFRRQNSLSACYKLEGLLLQLHRESRPVEAPPHHEQVRQLAERMRKSPGQTWRLAEEAEALHLSEVHLRRLFKQITGQAPGQFLLQCRLAIAADRLTGTLLPIKQIAATCGIENIHYFSRVFRRQYHLPPGRFRREFLGE